MTEENIESKKTVMPNLKIPILDFFSGTYSFEKGSFEFKSSHHRILIFYYLKFGKDYYELNTRPDGEIMFVRSGHVDDGINLYHERSREKIRIATETILKIQALIFELAKNGGLDGCSKV